MERRAVRKWWVVFIIMSWTSSLTICFNFSDVYSYRIIINISTNTQCTREYIHCIMVQVCQGGECVHSNHGLDLPGKTDNISRSGGQNTMYSQYKKQSHVFYWTLQLLLLSLIIRKCNSTCDRFLLLQNLLSLYPCLCDILLSITCIPSPALL